METPHSSTSRPGAPRRNVPDLQLPQEVHASRKRLFLELCAGAYLIWYGTWLFHSVPSPPAATSGLFMRALLLLGPWVIGINGLLTGGPALLYLLSGRPRLRLSEEGIEVRRFWLLRCLLPWEEIGDIRRSRWPFHRSSVTIRRRRPPASTTGQLARRRAPGLRTGRVRINALDLSITPAELVRLLSMQAFAQPFREQS